MKKFYAVAESVPITEMCYLTAGKVYSAYGFEETPFHGRKFNIIGDQGLELYCLEIGCAHLDGGNWTITEESEGE